MAEEIGIIGRDIGKQFGQLMVFLEVWEVAMNLLWCHVRTTQFSIHVLSMALTVWQNFG